MKTLIALCVPFFRETDIRCFSAPVNGLPLPGELRSRAARMYEFSDMAEVESTLEQLANREDGPFVVRLAREPGKRESRYMHLFSGEVEDQPAWLSSSISGSNMRDLSSR